MRVHLRDERRVYARIDGKEGGRGGESKTVFRNDENRKTNKRKKEILSSRR